MRRSCAEDSAIHKEIPNGKAAEAPVQSNMALIELSVADIHRFVQQRIGNAADAADIAQQTLMRACANLATLRGENLRAWLFSIARNLIIDYYRAQNRFEFVDVTQSAYDEAEPALRTLHEAVPELCEHRERIQAWLDCIARELPLHEQVALLLADLYGHADKDSAAAMDMSLPSFKLLLHQARSRLQKVFDLQQNGTTNAHSELLAPTSAISGIVPKPDSPGIQALRSELLQGLERSFLRR